MKISVIVPVYNTGAYLTRCIDSLRSQTLQELQIILVDDGSTDGSGEVCDRYAAQDTRIRVIHQENQGQGMARNHGLDIAEGEYISFVDSDDTIAPDMYEKMYAAAVTEESVTGEDIARSGASNDSVFRSGVDMVLAGMKQVGGSLFADEKEEKEVCCFAQKEIFEGEEGRKRLMLGIAGALPEEPQDSRYNFSACKNIYRNEIIQKYQIRFLSERQIGSEDVIFLLSFTKWVTKAVGIPGAFYSYYRNESSFTRTYTGGRFLKSRLLLEEMRKRLLDVMPETEFQLYLDRMFQAKARMAVVNAIQDARACNIKFSILRKNLLEICGDEELQKVLKRYPYRKLPGKQAIFALCMRYRLVGLQYLLVRLKE